MTPPSIASDRSPTPPEELPEGTLWIAPDGHLYTFGTRPWVGADGDEWIGADGAEWLGSGYIDAQDQLIVTTAAAAAAVTAAGARTASARRSAERSVGKGCVSTCKSRWWPDQ